MNNEKIIMSGKYVELAETSTHLLLTNRVCFYDEPNLNGVKLTSQDAEQYAETLVGMPVYAKYTTNAEGEPSFGGHEAYVDIEGKIKFNTTPIGSHLSVEIKDDFVEIDGKTVELPCLFAQQKIWKRNANAVSATKRLYETGQLHNSWEISVNNSEFIDGIKTLIDYEFEGNCFLGADTGNLPAYGKSAKVISLSSLQEQPELLLAEAIAQDLIEQSSRKEDNSTMNIEKEKIENQPVINTSEVVEPTIDNINNEPVIVEQSEVSQTPEVPEIETTPEVPEVSALTSWDISRKLNKALDETIPGWNYVLYIFPEEHKMLSRGEACENELDVMEFDYEIDENDEIKLSKPRLITLYAPINQMNTALSNLSMSLTQAESHIAELTIIKEQYDSLMAEKQELENEKLRSELKTFVINSHQFSEEEIASEEIATLISSLNKSKLCEMIANKIVEKVSLDVGSDETIQSSQTQKETHISGLPDSEPEKINYVNVIDTFIKSK